MKKTDDYGIEKYGKEAWENIVDNYEYAELQKSNFFMKLANNENMAKVLDVVKKMVNMEDLKFSWRIQKGNHSPYMEFESDNFVERDKILSLAWKDFRICSGDGWVGSNQSCTEFGKEDYYKEKATEFFYGFTVYYDYKHIDGGRNGAEIGKIIIYKDKIVYRLNKYFYKEDLDGFIICDEKAVVTVPFELE